MDNFLRHFFLLSPLLVPRATSISIFLLNTCQLIAELSIILYINLNKFILQEVIDAVVFLFKKL